MEGGPKSITWASEVMAYSSRVKTGVDSAKKNPQAWCNYVRDSFAFGCA
jgi:hypothetical protein